MANPEARDRQKGFYEFADLLRLRARVESFGLKLAAHGAKLHGKRRAKRAAKA